jgi:hypothetical protein
LNINFGWTQYRSFSMAKRIESWNRATELGP